MTSDKEDKHSESGKLATDQKPAQSRRSATLSPQEKAEILEVVAHIEANPDGPSTEIVHFQNSHSGPIPSPEDFERYDQSLPGAADRILSMAEKEQQIRAIEQEKAFSNDSRRINAAAILGLALIIVAGVATWKGFDGIAITLGLSGIIAAIFRQIFNWLNSRR